MAATKALLMVSAGLNCGRPKYKKYICIRSGVPLKKKIYALHILLINICLLIFPSARKTLNIRPIATDKTVMTIVVLAPRRSCGSQVMIRLIPFI